MDAMEERDTKDLKDRKGTMLVHKLAELDSVGSLGRTGIEGALAARLLFGVAPSDHEMLFVIMIVVLHVT